jgi:hypothetical protein
MKSREFKKLLDKEDPQKLKEEYMKGKHSFTDRQVGIICEKAGTGRGGVNFTYKKKEE